MTSYHEVRPDKRVIVIDTFHIQRHRTRALHYEIWEYC